MSNHPSNLGVLLCSKRPEKLPRRQQGQIWDADKPGECATSLSVIPPRISTLISRIYTARKPKERQCISRCSRSNGTARCKFWATTPCKTTETDYTPNISCFYFLGIVRATRHMPGRKHVIKRFYARSGQDRAELCRVGRVVLVVSSLASLLATTCSQGDVVVVAPDWITEFGLTQLSSVFLITGKRAMIGQFWVKL